MMGPPLGETRSKLDSYDFNNIVAGSHPFKASNSSGTVPAAELRPPITVGFFS
jgi:hypothetical protein